MVDEVLEGSVVFEGAEEELKLFVADHLDQLMLIVGEAALRKDRPVCTIVPAEKARHQPYLNHLEGSLFSILSVSILEQLVDHP